MATKLTRGEVQDLVSKFAAENPKYRAALIADAKGTPLGPDLTDDQWLWSDGSLAGIEATIAKGVPAPKEHTGVMPPMGGATLTQEQLHAVAAYVYALGGARRRG